MIFRKPPDTERDNRNEEREVNKEDIQNTANVMKYLLVIFFQVPDGAVSEHFPSVQMDEKKNSCSFDDLRQLSAIFEISNERLYSNFGQGLFRVVITNVIRRIRIPLSMGPHVVD